jgi:hypothetical protein
MTNSQLNISASILEAFNEADRRYPEISKSWITVSVRMGGRLPNSLLMPAVQRDGSLDRILLCMEDELAAKLQNDGFAIHYQKMLSDLWIGGVYEAFRLLIDRKIAPPEDEFLRLAHELRLLRIPLEKHEIAADRKLPNPLLLVRTPPNNNANDHYEYSSGDRTKTHIMPSGISARGSIMWQVIDATDGIKSFWIERRDLSDRILRFWLGTTGLGEQEAKAANKS